ncbi:hypothetical protein F5879DRAFT_78454 [Lentinula edodes]|nr:hypothetical protein F5879DRAFT_78454 [Lentinula edodes]
MISPFSAALSLLSLTTLYAHGQITSISETETKIISSAWLAGWHTANATPTFDLNNISWSKYTHQENGPLLIYCLLSKIIENYC